MPATAVPASGSAVTPQWVGRCLGSDEAGAIDGPSTERIGEGYGLASELLRVRLSPGPAPASVVVKLWAFDGPADDREIRVLRAFGDRLGPRVPGCLHAAVDEERGRAVMILEDLGDVEQGDDLTQLDQDRAERLARSVAALHGRWWRSEELASTTWLPRSPWLELDRPWFSPRRERFLERFADRLGEPGRHLLDQLEDAYEDAASRLLDAPETLLHDDLHLDNVVFDRATDEPILLDWARAARGPALLDLIELLAAIVTPQAADPALTAYVDELRDQGIPEAGLASLRRDIDAACVLSFTKRTCGAATWEASSPREQHLIELTIARAQSGLAFWGDRAAIAVPRAGSYRNGEASGTPGR